jgi:hypothetical protein
MPGIIASLGTLFGKSTIESINLNLGCSFYTLLAAQPSSGKSIAQSLAQNSFTMLENFLGVQEDESRQVNACSVEGFVRIMTRFNSVICKFTEYFNL